MWPLSLTLGTIRGVARHRGAHRRLGRGKRPPPRRRRSAGPSAREAEFVAGRSIVAERGAVLGARLAPGRGDVGVTISAGCVWALVSAVARRVCTQRPWTGPSSLMVAAAAGDGAINRRLLG